MLFGKAPNNRNIRLYGCKSLAHRHQTEHPHKFGDRAERGMYIVRADCMHREYILKNPNIIKSKQVVFDEKVFPSVENKRHTCKFTDG